jgi:methionyl aminopeptidase
MIKLKTPQDIEHLAAGGAILSRALDVLEKEAVAGAVPADLDHLAIELIAAAECVPSFLNYAPGGHDPFPAALCVSVNDAVVHGMPSHEPLKEGDVVGLDLGLVYKRKYFLDSARTVIVGKGTPEAEQLVAATKEALAIGIAAAQVGNTTGDIGAAIEEYLEGAGYGIIRELVGHGVGFAVHEEPKVPNFGKPGTGVRLEEGLVIAIEPMVSIGDPAVATGDDGWSVIVSSGNLTAHQEHTIAVTNNGPRILTLQAA